MSIKFLTWSEIYLKTLSLDSLQNLCNELWFSSTVELESVDIEINLRSEPWQRSYGENWSWGKSVEQTRSGEKRMRKERIGFEGKRLREKEANKTWLGKPSWRRRWEWLEKWQTPLCDSSLWATRSLSVVCQRLSLGSGSMRWRPLYWNSRFNNCLWVLVGRLFNPSNGLWHLMGLVGGDASWSGPKSKTNRNNFINSNINRWIVQ